MSSTAPPSTRRNGTCPTTRTRSGNDEDQCYRSANVTESNGTLKLTARRQTVSTCGGNPDGGGSYYFTSGMITTRGQDAPLRKKYRQGYLEVQMRVPRGNIYWAAIWLADPVDGSSPGWPDYGEVDGSEIYGSRPDVTESNFWRAGGDIGAGDHNVNNPPSTNRGVNINPPNGYAAGGTTNWHQYGINWTATQLQWFVDGVLVRTFTASTNADLAALSYEKSIIVNLVRRNRSARPWLPVGRRPGPTTTGTWWLTRPASWFRLRTALPAARFDRVSSGPHLTNLAGSNDPTRNRPRGVGMAAMMPMVHAERAPVPRVRCRRAVDRPDVLRAMNVQEPVSISPRPGTSPPHTLVHPRRLQLRSLLSTATWGHMRPVRPPR
jgi:hypothetical protein